MEDLDHLTEDDGDRHQLGAARRVAAAPGRLDEEVQQHVVPTGGSDEQVATGAQAREQRLADERRAHRGEGGVDRVATCPQRARARFGGQRMPGGHHSPRHRGSVTPAGPWVNAGVGITVLASGDRTARLRQLRVPTLVVHGADDVMCDVTGGRATATAILYAELVVIDGMGHNLPRQLWPELATHIAELVYRTETIRSTT